MPLTVRGLFRVVLLSVLLHDHVAKGRQVKTETKSIVDEELAIIKPELCMYVTKNVDCFSIQFV